MKSCGYLNQAALRTGKSLLCCEVLCPTLELWNHRRIRWYWVLRLWSSCSPHRRLHGDNPCSLRHLSELGIPCRYIRGVRDGVGHAWNMVFLRGGWFYIDVTDAIGRRDPFYHWGMTSLNDRTVSDQIDVSLDCTCPESFLKWTGSYNYIFRCKQDGLIACH